MSMLLKKILFQPLHPSNNSKSSLTHNLTESMAALTLSSVNLSDSGNYSCHPATLDRVTITLHVLRERKEQKLVVKNSNNRTWHIKKEPLLSIFVVVSWVAGMKIITAKSLV